MLGLCEGFAKTLGDWDALGAEDVMQTQHNGLTGDISRIGSDSDGQSEYWNISSTEGI